MHVTHKKYGRLPTVPRLLAELCPTNHPKAPPKQDHIAQPILKLRTLRWPAPAACCLMIQRHKHSLSAWQELLRPSWRKKYPGDRTAIKSRGVSSGWTAHEKGATTAVYRIGSCIYRFAILPRTAEAVHPGDVDVAVLEGQPGGGYGGKRCPQRVARDVELAALPLLVVEPLDHAQHA